MDFELQLVDFAKLVMLAIVPYILASQGTMLGGRTGLFNVAQEGIMLLGASLGFLAAYLSGSLWFGVLLAIVTGGLFGLALAYFTTTLKMNQFVIGLALFFIGLGLSTLFPKFIIGVTLQPPLIPTLQDIPIPILSRIPRERGVEKSNSEDSESQVSVSFPSSSKYVTEKPCTFLHTTGSVSLSSNSS